MLVKYYANRLIITVVDAGPRFTFHNVPIDSNAHVGGDRGKRTGGFGLPLLDAMSDLLEFSRTDPHGPTVRAEKRLRDATQNDADDARNVNDSGSGSVSGG